MSNKAIFYIRFYNVKLLLHDMIIYVKTYVLVFKKERFNDVNIFASLSITLDIIIWANYFIAQFSYIPFFQTRFLLWRHNTKQQAWPSPSYELP